MLNINIVNTRSNYSKTLQVRTMKVYILTEIALHYESFEFLTNKFISTCHRFVTLKYRSFLNKTGDTIERILLTYNDY